MKRFLSLLLLVSVNSCFKKDEVAEKPKAEAKIKTEPTTLDLYDFSNENPQILRLSSDLTEISGITFTNDERLFAHTDEYRDISEIDQSTGKVVKRFSLGNLGFG